MTILTKVICSALVPLTMFFVMLPTAQANDSSKNKAYAKQYISKKYGWGSKQNKCLVKLWTRESGWNTHAHNKSSGAHGIPQALPGSKMGKGWRSDAHVQIRWGAKYIKKRYGTPCKALSHSNRKGWY